MTKRVNALFRLEGLARAQAQVMELRAILNDFEHMGPVLSGKEWQKVRNTVEGWEDAILVALDAERKKILK